MIKNIRKMTWTVGMVLWMGSLLFAPGAEVWAEENKPVATAPGSAAADIGPDYILGPGDLIDIAVWKDETLTKSVIVLPDGKVSFPLIGEVKAAGRTIGQLKQEIAQKITPYAPDPIISIEVKQVNSMLIYVIGRVNNPGKFLLNVNVNVLQALAQAGGCNAFAKRDKIKIFRNEDGKTRIFNFPYDSVVDGKNLELNITLQRGDVVVVP